MVPPADSLAGLLRPERHVQLLRWRERNKAATIEPGREEGNNILGRFAEDSGDKGFSSMRLLKWPNLSWLFFLVKESFRTFHK